MPTITYVGGLLDGEAQDHDRLSMEVTVGIDTPTGVEYCDYELHYFRGVATFVAKGVDVDTRNRRPPTFRPVPRPRLASMDYVAGGISTEAR